jgi:type IV secretory pathway VirB10-like protein
MYELHVCQDGEWKRLKTFEARKAAMSASIELERARRFSAAKIFKLAYDPEVMDHAKKLIHRWSADDDRKVKDKEIDDNIDRQKQERRKIHEKRKLARERRKKEIRNYVLLAGLSITLVLALAVLSMLPGF